LQETCVIHNMNSPVDYRRLAHHTRGIYFLTTDRTALLHAAFLEAGQDSIAAGKSGPSAAAAVAAGGVGNPGPRSVQVAMGRQLTVPQAVGEVLWALGANHVLHIFLSLALAWLSD
jgi:predicted ATPase